MGVEVGAAGISDAQAYSMMGISSMNGVTDSSEHVTQGDFQTMLGYSQQHHLARLTFWSLNRDRPCDSVNSGSSQ